MISSPNRSSRGGRTVRLVVIHTAEGARTADSLGAYFARASTQASSHVGIDDQGVEQYVPYSEAAWTVRSANPISDNAELCGFAAWTREQWLDEHHRMLQLTAAWIRERCTARGIPIRKLTPAQVAAGQAGVCGHVDWTLGTGDGSHTDPGKGFPWDVVISLAAGSSGAYTPPKPHHLEEDLMYIKCQAKDGSLLVGILSGSLLIGLGTQGERASAEQAIAAGVAVQWVEQVTWDALAARNRRPDDVPALGVKLDGISAQLVAMSASPKAAG